MSTLDLFKGQHFTRALPMVTTTIHQQKLKKRKENQSSHPFPVPTYKPVITILKFEIRM